MAGKRSIYFGSADWMPRNFDRRVEAVAPVEDASLCTRGFATCSTRCLTTTGRHGISSADGSYVQREPKRRARARSAQDLLQNSWGMPVRTTQRRAEADSHASRSAKAGASQPATRVVVCRVDRSAGRDDLDGNSGDFESSSLISCWLPRARAECCSPHGWHRDDAQRALEPANANVRDGCGVPAIESIGDSEDRRSNASLARPIARSGGRSSRETSSAPHRGDIARHSQSELDPLASFRAARRA